MNLLGRTLLLEEAIFMPTNYLISEGIFDTVSRKIQDILNKICEGIQKVLEKSSAVIKTFIDKVKNNSVVVAIRKKLNLDEKLSSDKFKQFIKIKGNKGQANESVINSSKYIITEATKLSKTEEAVTDPKELQKIIQKYQDAISGKTPIKSKSGKQLSPNYCKEKLRLLKKKLSTLSGDTSNTKDKSDSNDSNDKKPVGTISLDSERN